MQKKGINQELTRAEEEVMQILWKLGKGFVKDIVKNTPTLTGLQHCLHNSKDT
jgi:predicted transcriptional regulator